MKVKTQTATRTLSERLESALKLPNGARFYHCAFQVNPFAYLTRHSKQTSFLCLRDAPLQVLIRHHLKQAMHRHFVRLAALSPGVSAGRGLHSNSNHRI